MMTELLRIITWNANGLCQHAQELKSFLRIQNVDILLVSETHFTDKSFIKIPSYKIYHTKHPSGKGHGGSAIVIKDNIKHHELQPYVTDHIQATSVRVDDLVAPICITALYCPPRHSVTQGMFQHFFSSLGNRFIAGGDFNAKHTEWASRIITPKGRELLKAIENLGLKHMSSGEPTYWPSDPNKTPDLIDFFVFKGIDKGRCKIESINDLSSDHSPVLLSMHSNLVKSVKPAVLCNGGTNWMYFREDLENSLSPEISLKSKLEIEEAVLNLTQKIQAAAWKATPVSEESSEINEYVPKNVKLKILEKRRLRKRYQSTRSPEDKKALNKATKELKLLLKEVNNAIFEDYITQLSPNKASDYSLWKATKSIKRPTTQIPPLQRQNGSWGRSDEDKANIFAEHLVNTFQPWTTSDFVDELGDAPAPYDMAFQEKKILKFTANEIQDAILQMNPRKAPGFDLVTARILRELPSNVVKLIRNIFNAILRLEYFPLHFKVGKIIMFPKPGKKPEEVSSYRPICLLPFLARTLEKLLLNRVRPLVEEQHVIPDFQFGFRGGHSTIEQIHRVVGQISEAMESQKYCTSVFLDVRQAFDRVWHRGLIWKIRSIFPKQLANILESYLTNRTFYVSHREADTHLHPISAGVPQGSVLAPLLFAIFTADMPVTKGVSVATYADDTVVLASDTNPNNASVKLQNSLNSLEKWMKKWKIGVNESKSVQVTFTLKQEDCPPVKLNNQQIPVQNEVKYLGLHIDKRLTWRKHIWTKRCQLSLKLRKMYWLLGRRSKLSVENKILLYKCMLKPVWTYGIELWGTACKSNVNIIQRFENKVLRQIVSAPWYVPNEIIRNDLEIPSVEDVIRSRRRSYAVRLLNHPNPLARVLLNGLGSTRLKRMRLPRL